MAIHPSQKNRPRRPEEARTSEQFSSCFPYQLSLTPTHGSPRSCAAALSPALIPSCHRVSVSPKSIPASEMVLTLLSGATCEHVYSTAVRRKTFYFLEFSYLCVQVWCVYVLCSCVSEPYLLWLFLCPGTFTKSKLIPECRKGENTLQESHVFTLETKRGQKDELTGHMSACQWSSLSCVDLKSSFLGPWRNGGLTGPHSLRWGLAWGFIEGLWLTVNCTSHSNKQQ